jgi:hypothetical protein
VGLEKRSWMGEGPIWLKVKACWALIEVLGG